MLYLSDGFKRSIYSIVPFINNLRAHDRSALKCLYRIVKSQFLYIEKRMGFFSSETRECSIYHHKWLCADGYQLQYITRYDKHSQLFSTALLFHTANIKSSQIQSNWCACPFILSGSLRVYICMKRYDCISDSEALCWALISYHACHGSAIIST